MLFILPLNSLRIFITDALCLLYCGSSKLFFSKRMTMGILYWFFVLCFHNRNWASVVRPLPGSFGMNICAAIVGWVFGSLLTATQLRRFESSGFVLVIQSWGHSVVMCCWGIEVIHAQLSQDEALNT